MIHQEHLSPDRLKAMKDGLLSEAEMVSALGHLGQCDRCADAFAECYGSRELLVLPPGFRQAVFSAVYRADKMEGKNKAITAAGKRELYRYGFRVSVAACITLLLLFSGTMNYGINFSRSIRTDLPEVNVITESLRGFSDRLIQFEITDYLKEEF